MGFFAGFPGSSGGVRGALVLLSLFPQQYLAAQVCAQQFSEGIALINQRVVRAPPPASVR